MKINYGIVDLLEYVTRFIFQKSHFQSNKLIVRFGAFIPPKNKRVSVFRIKELIEDEVWEKGVAIGEKRRIQVKARADIQAKSIYEIGLSVDHGTGQTRHADIIGWEDSTNLIKATELALRATLKLLPLDI